MAKRDKQIQKRVEFSRLALNDSGKAANKLRDLATGLENCRNTCDVIQALSEIFAVSERTISNDLSK